MVPSTSSPNVRKDQPPQPPAAIASTSNAPVAKGMMKADIAMLEFQARLNKGEVESEDDSEEDSEQDLDLEEGNLEDMDIGEDDFTYKEMPKTDSMKKRKGEKKKKNPRPSKKRRSKRSGKEKKREVTEAEEMAIKLFRKLVEGGKAGQEKREPEESEQEFELNQTVKAKLDTTYPILGREYTLPRHHLPPNWPTTSGDAKIQNLGILISDIVKSDDSALLHYINRQNGIQPMRLKFPSAEFIAEDQPQHEGEVELRAPDDNDGDNNDENNDDNNDGEEIPAQQPDFAPTHSPSLVASLPSTALGRPPPPPPRKPIAILVPRPKEEKRQEDEKKAAAKKEADRKKKEVEGRGGWVQSRGTTKVHQKVDKKYDSSEEEEEEEDEIIVEP